MIQFLVKRFIGLLFVVIGVTFITFILGLYAPIDPIVTLLGEHFSRQEYLQLRHVYGLDLPWWQQYYNYLHNLFTFNLGLSYEFKNRSVSDILASGVPVSLELGFWGLLLDLLIGIPLGIISALKSNTWVDTTNMTVMLILYAIPVFVLAVFVQAFIIWLDNLTGIYWPVSQWGTPWQYSWSDIQFKLAPILVYAAAGTAYFSRLARTSMLEVLRQDYVRTARAKGLREQVVIYRHALRNAMIPLVTVIGVALGFLVVGAFFIEDAFNIPGIADITLTSIANSDYPVIQATAALLAVGVVLGNLLSDILYTIVDPRIKVE
jgi:ABC-type dipeptide/oligopeptide/nickel transport system permease component